jgi:hypothetical protein
MKRMMLIALVALSLGACAASGARSGNPEINFLQDDGYENLPPN